jgi:hypothetical protein
VICDESRGAVKARVPMFAPPAPKPPLPAKVPARRRVAGYPRRRSGANRRCSATAGRATAITTRPSFNTRIAWEPIRPAVLAAAAKDEPDNEHGHGGMDTVDQQVKSRSFILDQERQRQPEAWHQGDGQCRIVQLYDGRGGAASEAEAESGGDHRRGIVDRGPRPYAKATVAQPDQMAHPRNVNTATILKRNATVTEQSISSAFARSTDARTAMADMPQAAVPKPIGQRIR